MARLYIPIAAAALIAGAVLWLRYDAASDAAAKLRADSDRARLDTITETKGARDDAAKTDIDSLLDALGQWMRPGD